MKDGAAGLIGVGAVLTCGDDRMTHRFGLLPAPKDYIHNVFFTRVII